MSERLDVELVNRGLVESRERAKSYIMAGIVYVDNQKALKAGDKVKDGQNIEIRGQKLKYVSRGGLKLEKAVDVFDISLENKVCVDVGASTGGFTDCMLQNGATKVYSIDVGYGQLAWKLRSDERVVNIGVGVCNVISIASALVFVSGFIFCLVCFSLISATALIM